MRRWRNAVHTELNGEVPEVENGMPMGIVSIGGLAVERDRKPTLGDISAATPNR